MPQDKSAQARKQKRDPRTKQFVDENNPRASAAAVPTVDLSAHDDSIPVADLGRKGSGMSASTMAMLKYPTVHGSSKRFQHPLKTPPYNPHILWKALKSDDSDKEVLDISERSIQSGNRLWVLPVVGYPAKAPSWFDNYMRLAHEAQNAGDGPPWHEVERWGPSEDDEISSFSDVCTAVIDRKKQNLRDLAFALASYCDNRVYSQEQWEHRLPGDDAPALVIHHDDPRSPLFKVSVVTQSSKKNRLEEHPTLRFRVPTIQETMGKWAYENEELIASLLAKSPEPVRALPIPSSTNYKSILDDKLSRGLSLASHKRTREHDYLELVDVGFRNVDVVKALNYLIDFSDYGDNSDIGPSDDGWSESSAEDISVG